MECRRRLQLQYNAAMIVAQLDLLETNLDIHNYIAKARQRRRGRCRQFWTKAWTGPERRRQFGLYDQLMQELRREDPAVFTNFLRMSPDMFDELLERLTPSITKQYTFYRAPLEPGLKLALTLRHLASGSKYIDMRYGWRVPHNTISLVVTEVCEAIVKEFSQEAMPFPSSGDDWKDIADGFQRRWNFPHTLGALDGKHIAVTCPHGSGSEYYNYKKYYSIVLLALVDSDYKFIWADVGGRGSASDAQLWNDSDLKVSMDSGMVQLPDDDTLPHDTQPVPYFIIGDDAFALRPTMMKPYGHRQLTRPERVFNYRLSRARRVVENAFGILANRFQVLMNTMQHKTSNVRLIVTTCILLHNLMRMRHPRLQNNLLDYEDDRHNVIDGAWRTGLQMDDCRVATGPNRDNREGKKLRNLIRHWCNSDAGSVEWQDRMI